MGDSMNMRSLLKQGRAKLIAMKTEAFLVALSAIIVLSGPVYSAQSTVVGPSSTAVVSDTVVVVNHVEGKVIKWSPPYLTVQGDIYFESGSGEPAVVVKNGTQTFLITKNTKFGSGKEKHLKVGLNVKILFHGRGSGTKEAVSVLFSHTGDSSGADSDKTGPVQGSIKIYDNFNDERVHNKPQRTTVFTVNKPTVITAIRDYHWNDGRGAAAGNIWLVDQGGRKYGPWSASGVSGARGVQNAYWVVSPGVKIKAGTYTIYDSDPATWSQNPRSQGAGLSQVEGYYETRTTSDTTTADHPQDTTQTSTTKTSPINTTKTSTTTKTKTSPINTTQPQGGGWYMEGAPRIEKNAADLVNTGAYFNRSMNLADGSATGSMSWADTTGDKCKGTYTGNVSWTKPPTYMKPGSSLTFKATSKTSANNTCGYKNIGSGIFLKGVGLYIDVTDASPKPPVTFTVPKGSPGSKLVIEAFAKTANIGGKVTYTYVYK